MCKRDRTVVSLNATPRPISANERGDPARARIAPLNSCGLRLNRTARELGIVHFSFTAPRHRQSRARAELDGGVDACHLRPNPRMALPEILVGVRQARCRFP